MAQKPALSPDEQRIMNDLLRDAVEDRDLDKIKKYAQKGGDLNQTLDWRMKVEYPGGGSWEKVVNIPLYQMTVLRGTGALNDKDEEISDFFIAQGVKVDAANSEGWTALGITTMTGNVSRAKYLLEKGANPRIENNVSSKMFSADANTPFEIAAWLRKGESCRQQLIDLFMDSFADTGCAANKDAFNNAAVISVSNDDEDVTPITGTSRRTVKAENSNNTGGKGDALKL